jgi:hypothetical protein
MFRVEKTLFYLTQELEGLQAITPNILHVYAFKIIAKSPEYLQYYPIHVSIPSF